MIRVLLAEDQAMVRGALSALLTLEEDIKIVSEVARADQIIESALATNPDIALLDIEMPGGDGLTEGANLKKAIPDCKIIILTTFGRPGYLQRAMESGISGFLVKDTPASELAIAIRRVMAGERVIDPEQAIAALSLGQSPLTDRECAVLKAAADGSSNEQIARSLHLSEGTVRNYLSAAIQKLDAHNRSEAVRMAEQKGWL